MERTREVGTLWIGGALSWLEQLCLKSFVDAGQQITLFSYHDIPNVPEGVLRRDGREVLQTETFLKYERKDSYALFADLFRLHMLRACPGMIWVDTDVYCHRPMRYGDDHVFGLELPDSPRINNAVLGLPADSAVLAEMLEFTSDPYAIPPFVKPALRAQYEAARAAGNPVHVGQQPWTVWGPMMLTHFVARHGLGGRVQPLDAFYPVPFPDRIKFLRRAPVVEKLLTARTTALHLWASNKRELGIRHAGLVPEGSYLEALVRRHQIRPETAPIRGRAGRVFEGGLIEALEEAPVTRVAALGGSAQALLLAAWHRWGCDVDLIDLDAGGGFAQPEGDWIAPCAAALQAAGMPKARLRHVRRAEDLRPVDVIVNLHGFGDRHNARWLGPVLERCLGPETRMLVDVRKGSGTLPLLRGFGQSRVLSRREDGDRPVDRVLFRAAPPTAPRGPDAAPAHGAGEPAATSDRAAATPGDDDWAAIAANLAGPEGFYSDNGAHSFVFIPRGPTLVVTFDNLDLAMTKREERRPWGFSFIEKQGWSMLGVMAAGWTWYRDPWVVAEFDRLAAEGFFARFERVVFYGASMGGYGACAFVAACPGADVVAISPQSTLDRALVPWETRYSTAWGRDFGGPYGDAAKASRAAGRVTLLYDPYEALDAAHVARFTAGNVMKLRAPLMGHRLGSSLSQMGILTPVTLGALTGTLDEAGFYGALRARRGFARYQRELFDRAVARGRPDLARRIGRWVLTRGDHRYIRRALRGL